MIGIIGDSNSGKSTLLNALLGQRLLPQSYKSSTSTITLASLASEETPKLSFMRAGELETVEGKRNIHTRVKGLNEEIRGMAAQGEVMTLRLTTKAREELVASGACDGTMTLVDMPGQDESDNPVVKECFSELLTRCHGLFIVVKHDAIKSDRLAVLVDNLAAQAPHLLRTQGAITFIISQADTLRFDDDELESDGDSSTEADEESKALQSKHMFKVVKDVKRELRKFLCNRDCLLQFPSFTREVEVLITSVDSKLVGGFEFDGVMAQVTKMHGTSKALRLAQKFSLAQRVYEGFCDLLLDARPRYPARAEQVIKAADAKANLDRTLAAVSAISFAVTIPLGGWGAVVGGAVRLTAAGVALGAGALGAASLATRTSGATQLLANANASAAHMALIGEEMVSGHEVGAIGAEEANKRIGEFWLTRKQIDEGKAYEDTLLMPDGSPLYIGAFVKDLPEGKGRLFWPSTNYECFIGDFVAGLPREGVFLNEKGFFIGRMRVNEQGHLEAVDSHAEEDILAVEQEW